MSSMGAFVVCCCGSCCCDVVVVVVVVVVFFMTLAGWRHKIDGVHKAFCRTAVRVPRLLNQFTNVGGAEVEVGQFHSFTDA